VSGSGVALPLAAVAGARVQRAGLPKPLVGPPVHSTATHQRVIEGVATAGYGAGVVLNVFADWRVQRRVAQAVSTPRLAVHSHLLTAATAQGLGPRRC